MEKVSMMEIDGVILQNKIVKVLVEGLLAQLPDNSFTVEKIITVMEILILIPHAIRTKNLA